MAQLLAAATALVMAAVALTSGAVPLNVLSLLPSTCSCSVPVELPSTRATAAAATTTPAVDGFVPGSYLEETRPTPGEVTLTLHDPDGSAVRTVYSAPTYTVGDDLDASTILDAELAPARRATGRDDAHAHLDRTG